ncbi:MAG TPA: DsrE family protein [Armatimonadota bacterium]|jgi:predicted peroxiredoxin
MKKVAYLVTRGGTQELIGGCLLNTVSTGRHGAQVVAMHFAEDGVYHLVKGSKNGEKVARAIAEQGVKVTACECSVENRGLKDLLIEGVEIGHFSHFFAAAEEADHVIAL